MSPNREAIIFIWGVIDDPPEKGMGLNISQNQNYLLMYVRKTLTQWWCNMRYNLKFYSPDISRTMKLESAGMFGFFPSLYFSQFLWRFLWISFMSMIKIARHVCVNITSTILKFKTLYTWILARDFRRKTIVIYFRAPRTR